MVHTQIKWQEALKIIATDKEYQKEQLAMAEKNYETMFWMAVAESSCDFWMHPSNDAYEKALTANRAIKKASTVRSSSAQMPGL